MAPRRLQDGPKTPQHRPNTAPRRPQDGPTWPRDAPRRPNWLQDGPTSAPRASQEGSKRRCVRLPRGSALRDHSCCSSIASSMPKKKAQNASKRAPILSQEGPTGSHIGPKTASREHQEASKKEGSSPADRSWMGQDGPKTFQDRSGCVYPYVYVCAYVYVYVYMCVYLFHCMLLYFPSTDTSPDHRF